VLHLPGKEKSADFNKALQRKVSSGDFNFPGVWFPDGFSFDSFDFTSEADFSRATFGADANYGGARFGADVNFNRTIFKGRADFNSAIFGGRVDFDSATFCSISAFNSAIFNASTNFRHTAFDAIAYFNSASFRERADFRRVTFSEDVDFSSATFDAKAHFGSVRFNGSAFFARTSFNSDALFSSAKFGLGDFSGATFGAAAGFTVATFSGKAAFVSAKFKGEASFRDTRFVAEADFLSAVFTKDSSFQFATFSADANFKSVSFEGAALFPSVTFDRITDFRLCTFAERADFFSSAFGDYARFSGNDDREAFIGGYLNLQYALVKSSDRLSFHTLTLRPHFFVNIDSRKFDFTNVDWDWRGIDEEIESLQTNRVSSPHALLAIAARHLAVNAEENHRYEDASKFRYMAQDARRLEHWRGFAFWRLSWWYWLASGYGERIARAFLVLLLIWFVAGLLYTRVGFARWEPRLASEADVTVSKRDDVGAPLKFSRAFTYSAGVVTLQKPEPRPATTAAQAVVLLETILGPVQAALLALAIRRKFMR